jgi:chemotaxis protein methyltransferase CheR
MNNNEIEQIEIDLLLDCINKRWGYDFRSYARASIDRRIRHFKTLTQSTSIAAMIPEIIHNESFFSSMINIFSIPVTEMFRDPEVYLAIRQKVVPYLKTYPHIKIWSAGCATGEEVYSLAILLKEEGIYDRSTIFATDYNDVALQTAKQGIFPIARMKEFTANYQSAGGLKSFSDYYHSDQESIIINQSLKNRITFSNYNLVTDTVFGEMHLIFCRNVLIYFNSELQTRVHQLFNESLTLGGFLCLGNKESLRFSDIELYFKVCDEKMRIYQKVLFRLGSEPRSGKVSL